MQRHPRGSASAWEELTPVYGYVEKSVCNICGAEITGNEAVHGKAHMLAVVSNIVHIRYTFGMTKTDDIYEAVDDFGLITSAEAKTLGVSNAEMVQLARRGKLERVARGIYRMPIWPYQEAAPYALAVRTVGTGAYLYGESVAALLNLIPTDPSCITVATPARVRKTLMGNIRIINQKSDDNVVCYEGVPSQFVGDALVSASKSIGSNRVMQAANEALSLGYITRQELGVIEKELES